MKYLAILTLAVAALSLGACSKPEQPTTMSHTATTSSYQK